jgi:hypothetical protein
MRHVANARGRTRRLALSAAKPNARACDTESEVDVGPLGFAVGSGQTTGLVCAGFAVSESRRSNGLQLIALEGMRPPSAAIRRHRINLIGDSAFRGAEHGNHGAPLAEDHVARILRSLENFNDIQFLQVLPTVEARKLGRLAGLQRFRVLHPPLLERFGFEQEVVGRSTGWAKDVGHALLALRLLVLTSRTKRLRQTVVGEQVQLRVSA